MTDFSHLEKIGEIARLMKIPPGIFKQMKEELVPGVTAPIPRYPGWMYLCPKCHNPWQDDTYQAAWFVLCPRCKEEKK